MYMYLESRPVVAWQRGHALMHSGVNSRDLLETFTRSGRDPYVPMRSRGSRRKDRCSLVCVCVCVCVCVYVWQAQQLSLKNHIMAGEGRCGKQAHLRSRGGGCR